MLEVVSVTKYYGALAAVRNVSFTVRPGDVLGYLGPNGSGKSTTVNMVAGLLEPTDGEIRVHGENIRNDLLAHRRRIGYVPETPDLYSYLTGPEYLTLVGRLRQMEAGVLDEKIDRFLRLFDIYDDRHARLSAYSKGMRQKIRANRVFVRTEIDDKSMYLGGSRKAMWLLGALPIVAVTLPAYAWLWGPAPALGHTVFWLLMAGGLTELLLYRFRKVPFACGYVPGKANVKYLWPVYALALTAYAWWTARLELWLLAEPVRWGVACTVLVVCLGACIALRQRRLASSTPLTYEEAVEEAVQVLGVMRT